MLGKKAFYPGVECAYPAGMLAQKAEEMLERRRAHYTAWAKEFGFDPPPEKGGWKMLDAYAEENEEHLERADILSELKWIDEHYAR